MTGYGRSGFSNEEINIDIEIKSVNSRFLDLKFYMPRELQFLESNLKNTVKNYINRGKVDIKIKYIDENPPDMVLDEKRFNAYLNLYKKAANIIDYKGNLPLDSILNEKEVIRVAEKEIEESNIPELVTITLVKALKNHEKMAITEGESMGEYLIDSMNTCTSALSKIEKCIPEFKESMLNNMKTNIENILQNKLEDNDIKRLMLETAIYIDKSDITEELVRLKDHNEKLIEFLKNKSSDKGKKLNFILQEMHREINTIGSKFNIKESFDSILIIKEEIEKCREIVQNVQ